MLIWAKRDITKETFQILNKNLNFVPTQNVYNKCRLNEEMQTFYGTIRLKGYFKDLNEKAVLTEGRIFKPTNHKKCVPYKIHHTVLTYIEATQYELECKLENTIEKFYKN